jgi:DNA-binding PadR family transcriptional regulator
MRITRSVGKQRDSSRDELEDFGRFSEPALLILISLADGAKHGYAMTDDIASLADVQLGPGTLYGAIARLESRRLIEPIGPDDRRNPYRITALGEKALKLRLSTLEAVARAGRRRLAAAGA